jgi:hypothetical protein
MVEAQKNAFQRFQLLFDSLTPNIVFAGDRLKQCRDSWETLSANDAQNAAEIGNCLHMLVLSVAPRFFEPNGIPALKIEQLDPMAVKGTFSVGSEVVRGVTSDWAVTGIASGLTAENSRVA